LDPFAHLSGGLIRKSDSQNRPSGDVVGGHQMGDPVSNDAGFAASGTGENEKRPFGMLRRLALAGIQACKKIHEFLF
jgi:hypothetical protein